MTEIDGRGMRVCGPQTADYLAEHAEAVLSAIRHSNDLLAGDGDAWETTAWVRTMADAVTLSHKLREEVLREIDRLGGCSEVCVGVVRRTGSPAGFRWGVLVRLGGR